MRCQDIVSVFKNPVSGHSVLHPGPPNIGWFQMPEIRTYPEIRLYTVSEWASLVSCLNNSFLVSSLLSPFLPSLSLPLPFSPPFSLFPCVLPLPLSHPLSLSLSSYSDTMTQLIRIITFLILDAPLLGYSIKMSHPHSTTPDFQQ